MNKRKKEEKEGDRKENNNNKKIFIVKNLNTLALNENVSAVAVCITEWHAYIHVFRSFGPSFRLFYEKLR